MKWVIKMFTTYKEKKIIQLERLRMHGLLPPFPSTSSDVALNHSKNYLLPHFPCET